MPRTLIVNASAPMLKANAARQCRVTIMRSAGLGDVHVRSRESHAAREREIDEVPIDRVVRAREIETDATDVGLGVRHMRVVKRVDGVAEQPGERERGDDQDLGERLWGVADRLGSDGDEQHGHDDTREPQQKRAVRVILGRVLPDDMGFAGAEQRDQRQQKHDSGGVEARPWLPAPNCASALRRLAHRRSAGRGTRGSAAARWCCRWCGCEP